jgi:type II secretory pathway component GspD/PulD (secretin)
MPSSADAQRRSLAFRTTPIRSAILDVEARFNANIAVPQDFHGIVTVTLHDVTLDQALIAILSPAGYRFEHKGGVIIISAATGTSQNGFTPTSVPAILQVTYVTPERAASVLHNLFPEATVSVDHAASAVIVAGSPADVQSMRTVLQSLDVRSPKEPTVEAISLRTMDAEKVAARLRSLYPAARFTVVSKGSLVVRATPVDMAQIHTLVSAIDTPPAPAVQPTLPASTEAIRISQASPRDVARAIAHQFPRVRAAVSGSAVLLSGSPDDVTRAKALVAQIDVPPYGSRITQVYRIRSIDAGSVGDLISRSFPGAQVTVDKDLNALSVTVLVSIQQRIADAISQLDGSGSQNGNGQFSQGGIVNGATSGSSFEIVTLRSAVPSQNQGGGNEVSGPVIQTLQQLVPGLRVSALATPGQLALIGDPVSLRLAKEFLAKLDVVPPLVVLDTEVLEIDETIARNLGLLLSQPVISTSFSEVQPPADPVTGVSRLIGIGAITRTPLSLSAQLNLQIQRGTARVLADPRITTLSGHLATIRAGDTISILTTVGGGVGTITTTQLQNFQTGVTLDITPLVTPDDEVTVALHPIVNSLSGIVNGVPQISTRDTQTTVRLKNNQTLIIGGLIEENVATTQNKIPLLGDLPVLGGLFRNNQTNSTRNELIIVVTPHVLVDGEQAPIQGPALPAIPTPRPLPTLMPGARLPEPAGSLPRAPGPAATPATPAPQAAGAPPKTVQNAPPSPGVTPIALGGPNNIVSYGQIPVSNVAADTDPVNIFFASMSPAALSNGATVSVRLITTTNVVRATLTLGSFSTPLTKIGSGQWATTFPFASTYVVGQPVVKAALNASRSDGSSASVNLQVSLAP